MNETTIHNLVFETPDYNRGQIVTYSYATTRSGAKIVQRYDASDMSALYYWASTNRRLSAAHLRRYGLVEKS